MSSHHEEMYLDEDERQEFPTCRVCGEQFGGCSWAGTCGRCHEWSLPPLARHLARAEAQLNVARDQYHQMQLLNLARIISAALPGASSMDISMDMYDFQDELALDAVHAVDGTLLWSTELYPDPLAGFRYPDGSTWPQAIETIVQMVAQSVGEAEIDDVAEARPGWSRPDTSRPIRLFRIALPDSPASAGEPRVEIVVYRDPDDDTDVRTFLNGVAIVPEVTVVDPGRGSLLLSEWREQGFQRAGTASPAAAEVITEYYRDAEDSPFIGTIPPAGFRTHVVRRAGAHAQQPI